MGDAEKGHLTIYTHKWAIHAVKQYMNNCPEDLSKSEAGGRILKAGLENFEDSMGEWHERLAERHGDYMEAQAKLTFMEREEDTSKVVRRRLTFPDYVDNDLVNLFYKLNDYKEPEEIVEDLRSYLKTRKDRAEAFDQLDVIEKRIEEPLKYVFRKLEQKGRMAFLKHLDNNSGFSSDVMPDSIDHYKVRDCGD